MTTFLISEESALEDVTVFVAVLSQAMTEPLFEFSLEEKLIVAEELTKSMKAVVLPLPLVPEVAVELIGSHS